MLGVKQRMKWFYLCFKNVSPAGVWRTDWKGHAWRQRNGGQGGAGICVSNNGGPCRRAGRGQREGAGLEGPRGVSFLALRVKSSAGEAIPGSGSVKYEALYGLGSILMGST